MIQAKIPTAPFHVFDSEAELKSHHRVEWPWVLKLDGLAAGKGVTIAHSQKDVDTFCDAVWKEYRFGKGPHRVLAEQFISGREVSYIGFCDGVSFVPLESATDYKRLFDGNQGPNTGGMGAISPSPFVSASFEARIQKEIILPCLLQMQKVQMDFRGVLFIGLMIDKQGSPWVLEFNTRFGDPETQCVLPRLQSSLLRFLISTANRSLALQNKPKWDKRHSIYVVAASAGYPDSPRRGDPISGMDRLASNTQIFFGGVSKEHDTFVTEGGRVLGIGCLENTGELARQTVYQELSQISWSGMHYRKDIGR